MSLEQTLERTNELLAQIVTILQTGVAAGAELGASDTKPRTTRAKKDSAANSTDSQFPIYWLLEKHNSVWVQNADDVPRKVEGAVQVTKEVYEAKKAQFESILKGGSNTSAQTTAGNASTSPTAGAGAGDAQGKSETGASTSGTTQHAGASDASHAPNWDSEVLPAFRKLNESKEPGHGRDAVIALLKKFLPTEAKPTVPQLAALGRNAEILAEINSLLEPKVEEYDPLG